MIDYEKITNFFSEANRKFTEQLNENRIRISYFILNSDEKRHAITKDVRARIAGETFIESPVVSLENPNITTSFKRKIKNLFRILF